MNEVLLETFTTDGELKSQAKKYSEIDWSKKSDEEKSEASKWLLDRLSNSNPVGKGDFAQRLAYKLHQNKIELSVPKYIEDAIKWVIGVVDKSN